MADKPDRPLIDTTKEAFKEAAKEWMNEQFATFGKWTFRGLMVFLFTLLIHAMLASHALAKLDVLLHQTQE